MTTLFTAFLSFLVFATVIAAMAIGVLAGRAPIKGSCGGVGGGGCELCKGDCRNKRSKENAADDN